jgi:apolipoprotein D and lipocalin family protein
LALNYSRMKMPRTLLLSLLLCSGLCAIAFAEPKTPELTTVDRVDLMRYIGRWFEIARYQNRFERDCDRDVTATYTRLENGDIEVVNSCVQEDGKPKTSKGKAKIVDEETNAKLKVTFFWPFYGDYWIIDLDPQYRWVVIGEPRRKYLWILNRHPHMDAVLYGQITSRLAAKGYDASKLIGVKQTAR